MLDLLVLRQHEILEADVVLFHLGDALEEFTHDAMEVLRADGVEIVLAIATGFDKAGDSQQREVVADRGLALVEPFAERGDVQFAFPHQVHQDAQTGFVRHQLEDLDKVFFQLVRQLGNRASSPINGLGEIGNHGTLTL